MPPDRKPSLIGTAAAISLLLLWAVASVFGGGLFAPQPFAKWLRRRIRQHLGKTAEGDAP